MVKFRFQDLKIWQLAIQIAGELFDIADGLNQKRLYRFAEQLRGAGMSVSNNIAEGSGSSSKKEFKQFFLVYKDTGQYEAAISELLKSTELAPNIINPYVDLGNLYASRMKDSEKAKYYYTKGIESAPKAKSRVEDLRWMVQDLECH